MEVNTNSMALNNKSKNRRRRRVGVEERAEQSEEIQQAEAMRHNEGSLRR